MTQTATYDLRNNLLQGVSIAPGSSYSSGSDVNGDWVDASGIQGPVQFLCSTGTVSGSPSAQSINFELYEADDNSGTNAQKVSNQTEVTLTADKSVGIGRGQTTKPYVRVVVKNADSSFTGGTSPSQDVAAFILAQKYKF